MSFTYHPRQGNKLGYWQSNKPSLQDIGDMNYAAGGSRKAYHRFIIHGTPCVQSPSWILKHQSESSDGKMTTTYAIDTGTIGVALYGTNSKGQSPVNAVDFINYINEGDFDVDDPCMGGNCDACWESIDWIQWVDI